MSLTQQIQHAHRDRDAVRRRVATVVVAPLLALLAWALIRLAGVDLVTTSAGGGTATVGPTAVLLTAVASALAGWATVALLSRTTTRPGLWWPVVGSAALSVSIAVGPSTMASGGALVGLSVLHLVTGGLIIGGLGWGLPRRG